jgi:hypothetical protein
VLLAPVRISFMVFDRAAGKIGISLFDVAANSWEVSTGKRKFTGFN